MLLVWNNKGKLWKSNIKSSNCKM